MSAGGISYKGIIGHSKFTLPSVESWGEDMSILRDPPKSIMTRKIDKVGETSEITTMIDQSGDRACESINVYTRGVNPFVAVSYNNDGNNGGQKVNGVSMGSVNGARNQQARLPYALTDTFRPPVVPPQNLYPLSRLPRTTTSSFTKPGFTDFSKKLFCPSQDDALKGIKINELRGCLRPTATYKLEGPIKENFEVKYVIKNPTHITATSGLRTMNITTQNTQEPVKGINDIPLHANAQSNLRQNIHANVPGELQTTKYIQDVIHANARTNKNQNIHATPISDVINVRLKDPLHTDYTTPIKGVERTDYSHDDINLQRNLPRYNLNVNRGKNIHVTPIDQQYSQPLKLNRPIAQGITNHTSTKAVDIISSRKVNLKHTLTPGGYTGRAGIPSQNRDMGFNRYENIKTQMNDKVMKMQQGRF